jgi:hypothetical protein
MLNAAMAQTSATDPGVSATVTGQSATTTPEPAPESGGAVDPSVDPITEQAARLLDGSGLIARQAALSQSLLLMERQIRQAELIRTLLSTLGPDAWIEVAPGEFRSFAETPVALRERIALVELEKQLEELQTDDENSPSVLRERIEAARLRQELAEIEATILLTSQGAVGTGQQLTDAAGTDDLAAALAGSFAGASGNNQPPAAQPAPPAEPPPPVVIETPISLREVAGLNGVFWAVIGYGEELLRVEAGDILPGDVQIGEIGPNFINFERRGEPRRLILRN